MSDAPPSPAVTSGLVWKGPICEFLADTTREQDLEGSRACGKTTACLFKVLTSVLAYPGIWWLICRYSADDTDTKLRSAFERMCRVVLTEEQQPNWNSREKCYDFPFGSKVYAYGLKATDAKSRYSKLRGGSFAGIYNDQSEELPEDLAEELRAGLRQPGFPHQLIFSPNPPSEQSWLAGQFPVSNVLPGRRHYSLSLYDNAHNLEPETIAGLETSFPVGHAKHRTLILGQRGVNVIGHAVYGGAFSRSLHCRPLTFRPDLPLLEAIIVGKGHPCWIAAQRTYAGGLHLLGGLIGGDPKVGLFIEDFLPLVAAYREKWFPKAVTIKTCCNASDGGSSASPRYGLIKLLRSRGLTPLAREDANGHDVQLTMIERLAGHMRRRGPDGQECFAITNEPAQWRRIVGDGDLPSDFLADGCEAGYVWSEHTISVGNLELRQPFHDDWFEHGMKALELLELHFGTSPSQAERAAQRRQTPREYATGPASSAMEWAR